MAERTKLWIADTMKRLMQTKDVEKIRVSDICASADIERATFYYHFKDKYDLIAWIFVQDAAETDILSEEEAAAGLEKMRGDFLFYKRAYEDSSQTPLWRYMLEYFVSRYSEAAREKLGTETLPAQIVFQIRLYCYGTVGMTREWLLSECAMSAREAVRSMYRAMPAELHTLYFGE